MRLGPGRGPNSFPELLGRGRLLLLPVMRRPANFCKRGHPLTEENSIRKWDGNGQKQCRKCTYERHARNARNRRKERKP